VAERRVPERAVRPPKAPAREHIARYLKVGDGQARPARRPAERAVRPPKATRAPKEAGAREVQPKAPKPAPTAPVKVQMLKCYDCEGEVQPTVDQCPHCALFFDPVRMTLAA
jgi:hypothetical protein